MKIISGKHMININFDPTTKKDYTNYIKLIRKINEIVVTNLNVPYLHDELNMEFGFRLVWSGWTSRSEFDNPLSMTNHIIYHLVTPDLKKIIMDIVCKGKSNYIFCPRDASMPVALSSGDLGFIKLHTIERNDNEELSDTKVRQLSDWSISSYSRKNGPTWVRPLDKDYTHVWLNKNMDITDHVVKIGKSLGINPSDMTHAERGLLMTCMNDFFN